MPSTCLKRRKSRDIRLRSLAIVLLLWAGSRVRANDSGADVGSTPSVAPIELRFDRAELAPEGVLLRGADDRYQLVVTGVWADGSERNMTRCVRYDVTPPGIITIDSTGMVIPASNGSAVIHAHAGHDRGSDLRGTLPAPGGTENTSTLNGVISASIAVTVEHANQSLPVDFRNDVVPIFTKLGCNSGGCHGKSGGQNGFQLSLLGFEPDEDYEHLVLESRGRRLFPAAPDSSLLLLKATGRVPHGGGDRIDPESTTYRLLVRWIAQGTPPADPRAPTVTRIEVVPSRRVMKPEQQQQLRVEAHYSDGTIRDVTRDAQYEANDSELAEAGETGQVATKQQTGNVAVMARYQGHVGVFRATVPLGAPVETLPAPRNFIDELVFQQLKTLGLPPSKPCDDATFVRRSCLDIAGRLPTTDEVKQFLADAGPGKRDQWIDRLLDGPDYADYFANKWSMVLRNKRDNEEQRRGSYAFHAWIRDRLRDNKPYDQFVRDIVTASGEVGENPAVVWYREVDQREEQVEDLAQLFLGMRIKCARCHHHPFEVWSQDDYYSLAAFFSRVGRKPGLQRNENRIFHRRGVAMATNPKTGKGVRPHGLGADPLNIAPDEDPRHALVDWMVAPDNPFFARALVNRYWKYFFGRALVEPEDDMRVTNPASNPELLDALARHFVDSGYDLKHLVQTICRSRVYQLSAEPNRHNANDKQNYSRFYPRRLEAEVLSDAVDDITGTPTSYDGLPAGTRAVQLPDGSFRNYFLTVFGRPEASTACECERSGDGNLAQSLHLINSPDIQGKLSADAGQAAQIADDTTRTPEEKIRELYCLAYARDPIDEEVQAAMDYLGKKKSERDAYEDLVWVMINSKEFLFNH